MKRQMNVDDVRQKFEGSIVMFNKRPVLFNKIAGDWSCRIFDLMDQEEKQVEFKEDEFHPPVPRIGMVNINGSVLYVERMPVRKFKLGLNRDNLKVNLVPGVFYPEGERAATAEIHGLKSKALGSALLGKYPTKTTAFKRLSQFEGAVAFDKQFAVDSNGFLYYKMQRVGRHNFSVLTFDEQFKHLEILLDKAYEKSYRTV